MDRDPNERKLTIFFQINALDDMAEKVFRQHVSYEAQQAAWTFIQAELKRLFRELDNQC